MFEEEYMEVKVGGGVAGKIGEGNVSKVRGR